MWRSRQVWVIYYIATEALLCVKHTSALLQRQQQRRSRTASLIYVVLWFAHSSQYNVPCIHRTQQCDGWAARPHLVQKVPADLVNAAACDDACGLQLLLRVVMPQPRPVLYGKCRLKLVKLNSKCALFTMPSQVCRAEGEARLQVRLLKMGNCRSLHESKKGIQVS